MYTATIKSKTLTDGILTVEVEFTDGTTTLVKSVIPQDENGLKYFVKGELNTLNSAPQIDTDYAVGATIDVSDPAPADPTADQIAQSEWLRDYQAMQDVQKLIDMGVVLSAGAQTKVEALRTRLGANLKAEYLNLI